MTAREFTDIYLPLSESLYRVAYRLLGTQEDAEDAVQDLYLKLWAGKGSLDAVYNPEAYSISILRNICIDRIRRENGRRAENVIEEAAGTQNDSSEKIEQREKLEEVARLCSKLSPNQKILLKMRIFEDLSYDEMAERTGMSKLTMRVLLSQAKSKIKRNI